MKRLAALCLLLLALLPVAAARSEPPPLLTWWNSETVLGLEVDAAGQLWAARYSAAAVCNYNLSGEALGCWGTDGRDPWSVTAPGDVALDGAGRIYVVEIRTHDELTQSGLQSFTTDGTFIASFGVAGVGPGQLVYPTSVAIGPDGGIYLMDQSKRVVHVFAPDGTKLREWPAQGFYITIDRAGIVYMTDEWAHRVRKFTLAGELIKEWGVRGVAPGEFDSPAGIALDPSGNIYVADAFNHRIQMFTNDGQYVTEWGGFGYEPGKMYRPMGVAVDDAYNVYVADTRNRRIQKFGPVPTAAAKTSWGRLKALYR